jgi:hypothetical protein
MVAPSLLGKQESLYAVIDYVNTAQLCRLNASGRALFHAIFTRSRAGFMYLDTDLQTETSLSLGLCEHSGSIANFKFTRTFYVEGTHFTIFN